METTDLAAHVRSIYAKIRLHCRLIAVFIIFFQIIIIICHVPECSGMFHVPAFTNACVIKTATNCLLTASGCKSEDVEKYYSLSPEDRGGMHDQG